MPLSTHIDNCCKTEPKFLIFPFSKFHHNDVSARLAKKKRYFLDVFSTKFNTIDEVTNSTDALMLFIFTYILRGKNKYTSNFFFIFFTGFLHMYINR